ncbi:TetR family transcriptional regulator [uncultured Jatrophihabitans sp.]|uniref:TetR family transcriptional regulator n=1 Tax=uncultured Jatrophihabitans sp. TaxID=1610747 RepID=UPI0035CB9967
MGDSRSHSEKGRSRDSGRSRGSTRRPSSHERHGSDSAHSGSRAERKQHTRRRLLDVTLRLIADRSLAGISLREVAREAGIVPTAFYRHFASMDDLGMELVDESMRPLRQGIREARRDRVANGDIIADTVAILSKQVRDNPDQFRFLMHERYGGVPAVRRSIAAELQLFTSDLTVDLSRLTVGLDWTTEDLEMAAGLMVMAMLGTVMELLDGDGRFPEDIDAVLERARRQLRLITLGMGAWRSKP